MKDNIIAIACGVVLLAFWGLMGWLAYRFVVFIIFLCSLANKEKSCVYHVKVVDETGAAHWFKSQDTPYVLYRSEQNVYIKKMDGSVIAMKFRSFEYGGSDCGQ